jgi:hypothetical protein
MLMSWTTHRYRLTKVHASARGPVVLAVYATHTHPPWEWSVVPRSRWLDWLDGERNTATLPPVSIAVGCAGSWQRARARCEEASRATLDRLDCSPPHTRPQLRPDDTAAAAPHRRLRASK